MQITKAEKSRLGVFIIFTLLLASGTLFYLMGKHLLQKEDIYFVRFNESVDGLLKAADVKVNGVVVGRVTRIGVDQKDVQKVVVHFAVEAGTPIKTDMQANLAGGISITGLKSIELTGGSTNSPQVAQGGEVHAGISQMKMLTGQAEAIALKFETLINNLLGLTNEQNQARFSAMLESVFNLTTQLDTLILGNKDAFQEIPQSLHSVIKKMESTVDKTDALVSQLQKMNLPVKISQTIEEYRQSGKDVRKKIKEVQIKTTITEMTSAAKHISKAAQKMDKTLSIVQDRLGSIMNSVNETSENMADFSRLIRENPSLLLKSEDKSERGR